MLGAPYYRKTRGIAYQREEAFTASEKAWQEKKFYLLVAGVDLQTQRQIRALSRVVHTRPDTYEVKSDDTPSLLPEHAIAVRFHSIGGWGAITTGKNLGAIIGDFNDFLYERDKVDRKGYQVDVPIVAGDSGAVLVNADGHAGATIYAKSRGVNDRAWAVDVGTIPTLMAAAKAGPIPEAPVGECAR